MYNMYIQYAADSAHFTVSECHLDAHSTAWSVIMQKLAKRGKSKAVSSRKIENRIRGSQGIPPANCN